MEVIKIHPAKKFSGTVSVPGDKSISHRAAIIGSLCYGEVSVSGFLCSEDCLATLRAMQGLGVRIDGFGKPDFKMQGVGLRGLRQPKGPLDLGNSGTGLRLLAGVVSGYPFTTGLTGDESLRRRPMARIVEPLTEMGAVISGEKCPLSITGGGLKGIDYKSPIPSAQVKSCILLAGLLADGKTSVTEPVKSRDHTERMLEYLGADIKVEGLRVTVTGGSQLTAKPIDIPGDISSAAFLLVAGAVIPGADVKVEGVEINPTRSAYLDVLKCMGAQISGTRAIGSSALNGVTIEPKEVSGLIDELPILAVAGAAAKGKTVVSGAKELRVKECDRIKAMAINLKKMGVNIEEKEDGWVIHGGSPLKGATVSSFGDHRIAMSMVIAGLVAQGETVVEDTSWIETSFPGFMETINKLRG